MDHKDLLDSVISNMTNGTKEIENTSDEIMDRADNSIKLSLCTGETYLMDPSKFDWDRAVTMIGQLMENETAFRNMAYGIMQAAGNDDEETQKFIQNIISQLEEYLDGYQIKVDYRIHNPNLTDHQIAMFMLFDVNNITRTMFNHISIYSALSMLAPTHDMSSDILSDMNSEIGSEPSEQKTYRVTATACEGGFKITDVEETDDYKPDSVGIIEETGNGEYSVVLVGYDVAGIRRIAEDLFKINSINSSTGDMFYEMKEDSGLITE